ncbi:MAG: hypothetical protein K9N23_18595 [Akkermansiaceae bacterium]|nr:hypothetical protein [Akkermansiaceae bacterium]MCF7733704.1 hypothetical protein [Akkermansiaceae bacterium]
MLQQIQSAVEVATHLPRYKQIVHVLFKYGFGDVLKLVALQKVLGIDHAKLPVHDSGMLARPPAERLRLAIEELGPTFIKFGQVVSARRDLVTDEFHDELCKLQSHVPTFPGDVAKGIVAAELGMELSEVFSEFDEEPLAGASIAQVHRAVMVDGTVVAVKVQRPNIRPTIEKDLAVFLDLARFLDKHVPSLSSLNPVSVATEFGITLRKELDFTHEADSARRFAEQFEGNEGIHCPRVFLELSSGKVLTMEFLTGLPADQPGILSQHRIDPVALSERISILIYQQVFEFGFFHGDPHPGNMTILENGAVGLYDYGMMGSLSPSFRASIARLVGGLAEKDHRMVMRSLLEMSEKKVSPDQDELLGDIVEFCDLNLRKSLAEINLGAVLNSLLDLLRSHKLQMKGCFYLGVKALSQVEAVGRALNPDLNFIALGEPYASKIIADKYKPAQLMGFIKKLGIESLDFLETFPYELRYFWDRVRKGEVDLPLQHKIDPNGFEPMRKTLDSVVNRLAQALLAAALLICASILILSGLPPKPGGIPLIGLIPLIAGGYISVRLMLSIWKHGGL